MAPKTPLLLLALVVAVSCHNIIPENLETLDNVVPVVSAIEVGPSTNEEAVAIPAIVEEAMPIPAEEVEPKPSTAEDELASQSVLEEVGTVAVEKVEPETSDVIAAHLNGDAMIAKPPKSCAQIGDRCVHHNDCCSNSCLGYYKRCVS